MTQDTICAIATAQGGAIGIVRIAGEAAIALTEQLFRPHQGVPLSQRKSHSLTFGEILAPTGEVVDEVLVSVFRAPHSYTGEDATEIACHASPYILQRILTLLVDAGCRLARAGEFTQRAFLNGRMDLSQAEAVADLIASTTAANHKVAMQQMKGEFSRYLETLRERLLRLTALLELELDFSDHEDLEFADRSELDALAQEVEQTCRRLTESFAMGNALRNGLPVAIVGSTNSGKSTLLNALLNDDKAIVSDVHGTTRDVVEDTYNLGGTLFRFIDTAGLRHTTDTVEQMGIARSWQKLQEAQIVLFVIDSTCAQEHLERLCPEVLQHSVGKSLIFVFNKSDLVLPDSQQLLQPYQALWAEKWNCVSLSAATGHGLETLVEQLQSLAQAQQNAAGDILVTNTRHYEALRAATADMQRVRQALQMGLSGDLIAQDLRECLFHLAEITGGAITTDEVLGTIFKSFCIGK